MSLLNAIKDTGSTFLSRNCEMKKDDYLSLALINSPKELNTMQFCIETWNKTEKSGGTSRYIAFYNSGSL